MECETINKLVNLVAFGRIPSISRLKTSYKSCVFIKIKNVKFIRLYTVYISIYIRVDICVSSTIIYTGFR